MAPKVPGVNDWRKNYCVSLVMMTGPACQPYKKINKKIKSSITQVWLTHKNHPLGHPKPHDFLMNPTDTWALHALVIASIFSWINAFHLLYLPKQCACRSGKHVRGGCEGGHIPLGDTRLVLAGSTRWGSGFTNQGLQLDALILKSCSLHLLALGPPASSSSSSSSF